MTQVTVKQWGTGNDYTPEFLRMMSQRVIYNIPGSEILKKVTVEFRERRMEEASGYAYHTGNRIWVKKTPTLESMCGTIAHETCHLIQRERGDIRSPPSGKRGIIWKGKFYPGGYFTYDQMPWEIEAKRCEQRGWDVYAQLKEENLIPETLTRQKRQQERGEPYLVDLMILSPEERTWIFGAYRSGEITAAEVWDRIEEAETESKG